MSEADLKVRAMLGGGGKYVEIVFHERGLIFPIWKEENLGLEVVRYQEISILCSLGSFQILW